MRCSDGVKIEQAITTLWRLQISVPPGGMGWHSMRCFIPTSQTKSHTTH